MLRAWLGLVVICVPLTAFAEEEEPITKYPDGVRVMASDLTILRLNPTDRKSVV